MHVVNAADPTTPPSITESTSRSVESDPAGKSMQDSAAIARRYPTGTIVSVEAADEAIRQIKLERAAIDADHLQQEEACTPTFFTNSCLNKAKERRRAALATLRPVEIEANAFKRRARVEERDREIAAKQSKPQKMGLAASADNSAAGGELTEDQLKASLISKKPPLAKTRPQRAPKAGQPDDDREQRNAATYDKKLADSLKRQNAVKVRKAEAEQKRQKKFAAARPTPPTTTPESAVKPTPIQ